LGIWVFIAFFVPSFWCGAASYQGDYEMTELTDGIKPLCLTLAEAEDIKARGYMTTSGVLANPYYIDEVIDRELRNRRRVIRGKANIIKEKIKVLKAELAALYAKK